MGEKARVFAEDFFSPRKYVEGYRQLFELALSAERLRTEWTGRQSGDEFGRTRRSPAASPAMVSAGLRTKSAAEVEDCDWCAGAGYVYRDEDRARFADSAQRITPPCPLNLEKLELERLREMGYRGGARKPWQQAIRKDTKLGRNPYQDEGEVMSAHRNRV